MSNSSNKANADIQAEVDNNYAAFQVALPDLLTQYRGKIALMRRGGNHRTGLLSASAL